LVYVFTQIPQKPTKKILFQNLKNDMIKNVKLNKIEDVNTMKKYFLATAAVVTTLFLGACSNKNEIGMSVPNGNEKFITSDVGDITKQQVFDKMVTKAGLGALLDLVDFDVLSQQYEIDEAEVDKIIAQYKEKNANFEEFLTAQGFKDEAELRQYIELNLYRQKVADEISVVTDAELEKAYERAYEIGARHILVADEKTAKEIIKKLDEAEDKEATFQELAKEYGTDGTKDKGGDLGTFGQDAMISDFEDAAYALEVGTYTTEPVKTKFGYHVIYKYSEGEKKPFEEVKEELTEKLREKKLSDEAFVAALAEKREEAGFVLMNDFLEEQYTDYSKTYKKSNETSNSVVAKIKDHEYTVEQLYNELVPAYGLSDGISLIDGKLLEKKYPVDKKAIKELIDQFKVAYGTNYYTAMAQNGLNNDDEIYEYFKLAQLQDAALAEAYPITDEMLQQLYDEKYGEKAQADKAEKSESTDKEAEEKTEVKSFEDAKEELESLARQQQYTQLRLETLLIKFRSEANFKFTDETLQKRYETIVANIEKQAADEEAARQTQSNENQPAEENNQETGDTAE
jgi:foldase protein PrsA